jgi:isoleucyl-tRNA synthetase
VIAACQAFVEDLSNWYIRRSRRRFYGSDEAAFRTLWRALVQLVRVVSPIIPFLGEHLWQRLVVDVVADAPESVFLAGWPEPCERWTDPQLLEEVALLRRVIGLARRARGEAGIKLRQPLRCLYVRGAPGIAAYAAELLEELRVKEVGFDEGPVARVRLLPNLAVVGPRLGRKVPAVRAALDRGDFVELDDGKLLVAGEQLAPEEVIRGEQIAIEGWAVAEDDGLSIAFDTALDDGLLREGRVHDLVHAINTMRRDEGLELSDRIVVRLPERDADLLGFRERITGEVLATDIVLDGELDGPAILKV